MTLIRFIVGGLLLWSMFKFYSADEPVNYKNPPSAIDTLAVQ